MSDDHDPESKTEEATEKKLHDAVERGVVPVSREVSILASLAAILIILVFVLPARAERFVGTLIHFIDDPAGWRLERASDVIALGEVMLIAAADFLAPTAALLMVFGVVASVAQNPPRFVPDRIMPDLKRISPGAGLSRVFGPKGWTEFFKSTLKIVAVAVVVAMILGGQRYVLTAAMFLDVADLPQRILKLCVHVIAAVLVATLVVASADVVWARIHWLRDQRMSRHEVKEELKQTEGDRLVKARLRSLRLDRSRKRMLAAVPKATMVVANPTHYAIAMRYVRAEGGAPIVLAKGMDLIALKIREIAEQHSIPIVEDKPLARALYDAVAVDSAIPPEFYRAVAEIVHLIQEKKSFWPLTRNT
ncbi:MAG TPA: EscU/YscU/HrcU family type III secretion system export apparatus switch protein [Roseiarcus sp.]|nr:EscU/YscU/HrcU family type III secretion system export apparatus switch protein [Roseiarcus sp.]